MGWLLAQSTENDHTNIYLRKIPVVLIVVCSWLLFFFSSSEEKDGKTESKDEKGELIAFFSVTVSV